MSLCDSTLIDNVNRYFVPLVIEMNYRTQPLTKAQTEAGQRLLQTLPRYFGPSDALLQTFVVSSDGAVIDRASPMGPSADVIKSQVEAAIRTLRLSPGQIASPYVSNAHVPDAALQLRVVIRYSDRNPLPTLRQLHPLSDTPGFNLYPAALEAGTRDWVALSAAQCRTLLPPADAREGAVFEVGDEAARLILSHFRPEPSLMEPEGDAKAMARVQRATLQGRVLTMSSDVARAELRGHLEMFQPGLRPENAGPSPSDKNKVTLDVLGSMEWDPRSGNVTGFSLATDKAIYAGASGQPQLSFEAVAYRVPLGTRR